MSCKDCSLFVTSEKQSPLSTTTKTNHLSRLTKSHSQVHLTKYYGPVKDHEVCFKKTKTLKTYKEGCCSHTIVFLFYFMISVFFICTLFPTGLSFKGHDDPLPKSGGGHLSIFKGHSQTHTAVALSLN